MRGKSKKRKPMAKKKRKPIDLFNPDWGDKNDKSGWRWLT